jgi:hypothetical protein
MFDIIISVDFAVVRLARGAFTSSSPMTELLLLLLLLSSSF